VPLPDISPWGIKADQMDLWRVGQHKRGQIAQFFCGLCSCCSPTCASLVEKHLPTEHRAKHTWRYVGTLLAGAACGEDDAADVEIALRLVLAMEGVECRPQ
jgi:hypothetical protein